MSAGLSILERDKPSYQVVYDYLRESAKGAGEGVLIPPRAKLARQFNVAEGTVFRAITLLKERGFAYGQQGRGTYLCDRRQESAKIQQVAFLTPSLERDILRYSEGFDRVFHSDEDYSVSIYSSQLSLRKYKSIIEHIVDTNLGGVILSNIAPLRGVKDAIDISVLANSGIPVVLMGSGWPGLHCDNVGHARRDSARKMAARAVAGGCRNPGVFLGAKGDNDPGDDNLLDELNYIFDGQGIEIQEENIFRPDSTQALAEHPDDSIDSYNFTKNELSRVSRCDWLMFHDDGAAIGALRALREGGIKVPEQIKLLSGYRRIGNGSIDRPTAVDVHIEEQARLAAWLLKRRIEGYDGPVETHYVTGELIEGETT